MITNREELRQYLSADQNNYDTSLKAKILGYLSWYKGMFLYHLRYAEYYENKKQKSIITKILCGYHKYKSRKLGFKLGYEIPLNTLGPGVILDHHGTVVINSKAQIGGGILLAPGVIVGSGKGGVPVIGNNVTLQMGCKVYGGIRIGNNVTVAAMAVVTHDVPDNCVVAGIPAKILKYKE